jgi:hypothetical protein
MHVGDLDLTRDHTSYRNMSNQGRVSEYGLGDEMHRSLDTITPVGSFNTTKLCSE